jgi:hypothetical protein
VKLEFTVRLVINWVPVFHYANTNEQIMNQFKTTQLKMENLSIFISNVRGLVQFLLQLFLQPAKNENYYCIPYKLVATLQHATLTQQKLIEVY